MSVQEEYRKLDAAIADLVYRTQSSHSYERELFAPDEEQIRTYRTQCSQLLKEAQALETFDTPSTIFRNRFVDVLNGLNDRLERISMHPGDLLGVNSWYLTSTARLNGRSDEARMELSMHRLDAMQDVIASVKALLANCPESAAEVRASALYNASQLDLAFEDMQEAYDQSSETFAKLQKSYENCVASLRSFAESLPEAAGKKDVMRVDAERYEEILWNQFGVKLSELKRDYEKDIEETRSRVFALAEKLPIPSDEIPYTMREVSAVLNKYAGPADTAEEMFARINDYLARARKIAHENVAMPEDEVCRCHTISAIVRDTFPWGGYEGGDDSLRPVTGQMFLNNCNITAVTDGWMKINALHECYPGHHVQQVRRVTDRTPECVKFDTRNIPLIEGTAIRSETAFAEIYDDDPFYPVFAAYRRHHASVRIKVDLMLYLDRCSADECRDVYMEELGFDSETAMGQVRAQLSRPGYFTCYHYGLKKILELEKEMGMSRQEYTDMLFRAGDINIQDLHAFMHMSEEERYSYSHDYASMIRDFSNLPDVCL